MKRFKFAWIAACAFTVLAAVTFIGCGKEDAPEKAVTGLGGAASGPATVFDITTSRLEKGGISFSYTESAVACQMLDHMEYLADILTVGTLEERGAVVDGMMKEGKIAFLQDYVARKKKEVLPHEQRSSTEPIR